MSMAAEETAALASTPIAHMNIGNAQQVYADFGLDLDDFYNTVYQNLVETQKGEVELANSNYLHALQLTSLMLRKTAKSFLMLGGSSTNSFVDLLKQEFRTTLTRLKGAGGTAQMIVLNADGDHTAIDDLQKEFSGTLTIRYGRAATEESVGHFIVADRMVRIEEPHAKLTKESPANAVKARVIFNGPIHASRYTDLFKAYWGVLAPTPAK